MPSKSQITWDLVALTSLLGLVVITIWIHASSPLLTSSAPLSNSSLNELSVAVAIVATIYTMFVTDRIRHGFMRGLESELCSIATGTGTDRQLNTHMLKRLERSWRSVLRIDGFRERFSHLPSGWIFLRYLATGFLTASIITTFTPREATKYITYDLRIPGPGYPVYPDMESVPSEDRPCAFMTTQNVTELDRSVPWEFANGTAFWTAYIGSSCPATEVVPLIGGINSHNADEYAYVDSGIAVQRTAMGAPRNIFNSPTFSDLITTYGGSLNSTTQCVPVLKSNPIKCDRDPKSHLIVVDESNIQLVTDRLPPVYNFTYASRNLSRDNVMVNTVVIGTEEYTTPDTVGHGWMQFGGYTGESNATTSAANDLALIMGEEEKSIGLAHNSTYLVHCVIDPQASFEYRQVTMLLNYAPVNTNNHTGSSRLGYTRSLVGGDTCAPATPAVGWPHFAAVAISQEKITNENRGTDYYFSTIQRAASRWGRVGPPFAFPDSRNALEDALGVVAALGVSTMTATGDDANSIVPKAIIAQGQGNTTTTLPTAAITVSGFSSTSLILSLVLIPQLLTFACLMHLFVCSFRPSWQPGGGAKGYFDMDSHHAKRPSKFVAESLTALIALGGRMMSTPKRTPPATATPSLKSAGSTLIRLQTSSTVGSPDKGTAAPMLTTMRSTTF